MRVEIHHIGGAVPVKRHGVVDVATLSGDVRKTVERAVAAVRSAARPAAASKRIPDVGSSSITIVDDDGRSTHVAFSDAEASAEQAELVRVLRPYLRVVPWK